MQSLFTQLFTQLLISYSKYCCAHLCTELLADRYIHKVWLLLLSLWFDYLLSARDIHIVKELKDVDTMERQPVNFLCEVNQVDVDGRWYRDDSRIRPGENIKIRHQGKLSSFVIHELRQTTSYRV